MQNRPPSVHRLIVGLCSFIALFFVANVDAREVKKTELSAADLAYIGKWNSGALFDLGKVYNALFEDHADYVQRWVKYFQEITYACVENRAGHQVVEGEVMEAVSRWGDLSNNRVASGQVQFFLFEDKAPNAFATEFYNAGSVQTSNTNKMVPYYVFHHTFGKASEKFYGANVIGITDELLLIPTLTEGELAFVLAHEYAHIESQDVGKLHSGQDRELAADREALKSIAGRYPLTVAFSFFHKLNDWKVRNPGLAKRAMEHGESFLSTHPEDGVRYTSLQKEIEELRARGKDTAKADRVLQLDVTKLIPRDQRAERVKSKLKETAIVDQKQLFSFFTQVFSPKFISDKLTAPETQVEYGFGLYITPIWRWANENVEAYSPADVAVLLQDWMELVDNPGVVQHRLAGLGVLDAETLAHFAVVKNWSSATKVNQFLKVLALLYRKRAMNPLC